MSRPARTSSTRAKQQRSRASRTTPNNSTCEGADLLDAITKARGSLHEAGMSFQKLRRHVLSRAVSLGLQLCEASPDTWDRFTTICAKDGPTRSKLKPSKQNEAVRLVVLWYFAGDVRATKKASEVWRAVQHLLTKGMKVSSIPGHILTGPGIRAICDEARQEAKNLSLAEPGQPKKQPTAPSRSKNEPTKARTVPSKNARHLPAKWSGKTSVPATLVLRPKHNTLLQTLLRVRSSIELKFRVVISIEDGAHILNVKSWKHVHESKPKPG